MVHPRHSFNPFSFLPLQRHYWRKIRKTQNICRSGHHCDGHQATWKTYVLHNFVLADYTSSSPFPLFKARRPPAKRPNAVLADAGRNGDFDDTPHPRPQGRGRGGRGGRGNSRGQGRAQSRWTVKCTSMSSRLSLVLAHLPPMRFFQTAEKDSSTQTQPTSSPV